MPPKCGTFFQKVLALFDDLCYNKSVARLGNADVAQSVERILGKDEVTGSNPVISSTEPPEMAVFLLLLPIAAVKAEARCETETALRRQAHWNGKN